MRIVIINWTSRKVGGAETYIDAAVPELHRLGHDVSFVSEVDMPAGRQRITVPDTSPEWCASDLGISHTLAKLRDWKPDLIYSHGLLNPSFEAEVLRISPAVFVAHNYYGTCVSGAKSFQYPVARPCTRRFGWRCFMHYYPHRCGGLSPVTMWLEFRRQASRLALLRKYQAIIVASEYMRSEYLKHGFPPDRVHVAPFPVSDSIHLTVPKWQRSTNRHDEKIRKAGTNTCTTRRDGFDHGETRVRQLLFAGRMTFLKGGSVLLGSLPLVSRSLQQPLRLVFAGDGPDRASWERRARAIESVNHSMKIQFAGWVDRDRLQALFASSDLLVVPSVWPEPFGLIGPEAGLRGVPAAAFANGGIPEWLHEGINGHLAPCNPPTAAGLADAVVKCLSDPAEHARLRQGATEIASRFTLANHMARLLSVFHAVTNSSADQLSAVRS
jgi:glycosyltransferase involved in cell wall biosynthesis